MRGATTGRQAPKSAPPNHAPHARSEGANKAPDARCCPAAPRTRNFCKPLQPAGAIVRRPARPRAVGRGDTGAPPARREGGARDAGNGGDSATESRPEADSREFCGRRTQSRLVPLSASSKHTGLAQPT